MDPEQTLYGRVIGLEHDRITPKSTKQPFSHKCSSIRVPKGYCWIESDIKNNQVFMDGLDSGLMGPVPLGCIQGRVMAVRDMRSGWEWVVEGITEEQLSRCQFSSNVLLMK